MAYKKAKVTYKKQFTIYTFRIPFSVSHIDIPTGSGGLAAASKKLTNRT
jgi:hypothetical protein